MIIRRASTRSRRRTRRWPPSRCARSSCDSGLRRRRHSTAARRVHARGRHARARRSHAPTSSATAPPPSVTTPLVVQVSRWDRLKDPVGVLAGLRAARQPASARRAPGAGRARACAGVTDDPEGADVLAALARRLARAAARACAAASIWRACRPPTPTRTPRSSTRCSATPTVIVQKSLHEGFGLTVTEAMWKARPVVASAVGGIRDQSPGGRAGHPARPADLAGLRPRRLAAYWATRRWPAHGPRRPRAGPRALSRPRVLLRFGGVIETLDAAADSAPLHA